jgi:hypothetical protein
MYSVILFVLGAVVFTVACKSLAAYVSRREPSPARRDAETVAYGRTQAD